MHPADNDSPKYLAFVADSEQFVDLSYNEPYAYFAADTFPEANGPAVRKFADLVASAPEWHADNKTFVETYVRTREVRKLVIEIKKLRARMSGWDEISSDELTSLDEAVAALDDIE